MGGWYKRQRNVPERPWFKDAKVLQLYDYLEATAYVTDGNYEGQLIRRGSCPTTRPELMEATGLSYKEVDRCLRVLTSYGEIIVKGYYRFSIITVCGYDSYNTPLSLFGTDEGTTKGTTEGTTEGTAHLLTIEERYKDNLITHYIPYKKERERQDVALEVKKRYNKTFDGVLPPCIRLTLPTKLMVENCIGRFGLQSVDLVFEQIKQEPFSLGLGKNKTGFIANFQFIFTPKNFQQYLERAQLRRKKQQQPQQQAGKVAPATTQAVANEFREELAPVLVSPEVYEQQMREAAASGNPYIQRLVEQWDAEKNETK